MKDKRTLTTEKRPLEVQMVLYFDMKGEEKMSNQKYFFAMEINKDELNRIFKDLHTAQETIYKCYSRLKNLGVITLKEAEIENSLTEH